jgi:hypothetical protein
MIRYRSLRNYKYMLLETYSTYVGIIPPGPPIYTDYLELSREGVMKIRAGYAWDGPSGPAIDTPAFMRGSLLHDAGYQIIRRGLMGQEFRVAFDRLLRDTCLLDGMSPVRAAWVYASVRSMGWVACRQRDDREKVLEAP